MDPNKQSTTEDTTTTVNGRPLQRIPWSEKIANKKEWFKRNAEYYIRISNFNNLGLGVTAGSGRKDLRLLYQVYNSEFPARWFSHITDPLSATNPNYRKFPAKVRPVTILRTNIDLLLGEYPKRPFVYQVTNTGEDGYNSYTESLRQKIQENLSQHFAAMMQAQMQAKGVPVDKIPGLDQIQLPEELKEEFTSTYKDAIAIQGQHWLKRTIKEYHIRETFLRGFKDWLIAGSVCTFKGITQGNLNYKRISPMNLDYDKSPSLEYAEDGEWAVYVDLFTLSDIVDEYYDELTDADLTDLERRTQYQSPMTFLGYLQETMTTYGSLGKIPVYHVVWKGKKKVKILKFPDPITGAIQEMPVDEDYLVNTDIGETVEEQWVNVVYEDTQIGDRLHVRQQEFPVQRNAMNNLSICKLPYNARNYSDLHTVNISVLEMGLPYQIMYIIVNYILEKTIAKSKGKIMLIDKNAMPHGDGWDDEKFFYYSEALGYALMNRNQAGVDKTWNQYQVMDMSLFDQIKQLIELKDSFKQEWDDQLGITRPRKGEMLASDGKATSEMGLMQSSVITDMIFNNFEEFTERELQGILDYSKILCVDGIKGIYNTDDFDTELLNIDPNTYSYASLGILLTRSTDEMSTLNALKAQQNTAAMIQAGAKPSTIAEIQRAQNVAELIEKLHKIEELEAAMEQQNQQSEQEAQQAADQRKMQFAEFENNLKATLLDKEWDRRDQNEMIKGEFNEMAKAGTDDVNGNGVPDADEVEKRAIEREKIRMSAQTKREEMANRNIINARDNETARQEIKTKKEIADAKHETEIKKARISAKKKVTK